MPQSSQQQPQNQNNAVGEILLGLFRATCLTIDVFLHHRIGCNYVTGGFAGVLVLAVTACGFPESERFPLVCFAAVYGVLWLIAMISAWVRQWRGRNIHSGYTGRPYLCWLLPGWREEYLKQLEAFIAILVALVVHLFSRPLGDYLMVATSLVLVRGWFMLARQRHQVTVMNDLVIEQKVISQKFNDVR